MEEVEKASPCRYIALDIHKYYSVVAGVDREGKEILPACRVEHVDLEGWLAKRSEKGRRGAMSGPEGEDNPLSKRIGTNTLPTSEMG